ncbi:MAG: lysylphosphatidylglycerol synthase transmembrane domain-containing protein [Bradymonadaceae bacterium]
MARFLLYFLIANIIGAFFLWLTARTLPFGEVWAHLGEADLEHLVRWSLVFVGIYVICHGSRVFRWYYLVRPLGPVEPATVHRVCAVGFTAILLLPLRLGEVVRPYLLARRSRFPMNSILGTAVVERVIDGLLITGLLFVTLATYKGSHATEFAMGAGLMSAAIFVPALFMCLLAFWRRDWAAVLVKETFGRVHAGLAEKLGGMLYAFIDGFRALLHAQYLGRFLGLTVLYWGTNVLSMWVLARYGFGLDVGMWEMTTVLAILVIGIMIPAGPAMAGNFEYFMVQGLGLFVILEISEVGAQVALFAATVHILQFAVIVIPGFIVMWLDPQTRHLIRLSREAEDAASGPEEKRT